MPRLLWLSLGGGRFLMSEVPAGTWGYPSRGQGVIFDPPIFDPPVLGSYVCPTAAPTAGSTLLPYCLLAPSGIAWPLRGPVLEHAISAAAAGLRFGGSGLEFRA